METNQWTRLQELAEKNAKRELLEELMKLLGLDEYIADRIAEHERSYHDAD